MATLLQRFGVFNNIEQPRKTLLNLNDQRNASQFCDVVLRVCGTQIYAHASVLAAASPYFSSFLGTGSDCPRVFSQKQPQVIEIHIDNMLIGDGDGGYGEAVCKVVDYIYTNKITITTSLFSQITEIGKIMLLDQLILYCEEFQKGVDGNKPKDVSTCTSTLKEVVGLLATGHTLDKFVNAQTETEERLFEKVKADVADVSARVRSVSPLPLHEDESMFQKNTRFGGRRSHLSACDIPECKKPENNIDDSLVFPALSMNVDDGHKEQSDILSDVIEVSQSNDVKVVNIPSSDAKASDTTLSLEQEPVEDFNAIKSFEDILDYDASVGSGNASSAISENAGNTFMLNKSDAPEVVTEGELHDISDLVTFDSVSSTSLPPKPNPPKTGRPRGRPRKNKRKRGRAKGRREVHRDEVNEAESDYEFEQFMNKLEKGEKVELESQDNEDISMNEDEQGNAKTASISKPTMALKKSDRIKSKPIQLKRDYILHPLGRKSRKYGRMLQDKTPDPKDQAAETKTGEKETGLRFVCQTCDFTTSVFKNYVIHLKVHPERSLRKASVCNKCGFKTVKAREFKQHEEKHMIEELICVYCLFQASNLEEYEEHSLKHSGNLPYFCTECDARFKKKYQLESHKPKHWLEKPFTCPICAAGFKWKHALKNHMIVHTTIKDHLCDICGYATAHKSMLTAHRLVHTGQTLKCPVEGCLFQATKRQKLKMHMVTHTREKPHQCEVCGQRFSLAKNMRRHLLLHTNHRPYACKLCSFTTTRYDKLKDHNHKIHNIGGAPVPRKIPSVPPSSLLPLPGDGNIPQTATLMTMESITLNPDGTISAEGLQKIAKLAAAQQKVAVDTGLDQNKSEGTIINITQPASDSQGTDLPIIAHIHYADSTSTKGEETETVKYFQEIG